MPPKPSRRSISTVSKLKVEDARPLPEPADEACLEKDSSMQNESNETQKASSLKHNSNSGSTIYRERSLEEDLTLDSPDDSSRGPCEHLDDSGSSGFGNSVASFMSWSDDVELEATKKVMELMNQVEECLYEKEPAAQLKNEVALECEEWRKKFPHFRLKGVGIPRESFDLQRAYIRLQTESKSTSGDELPAVLPGEETAEGEIIAVHGSYEEPDEDDWFSTEVLSDHTGPSTPDETTVYNKELKGKVKNAILDKLFNIVWSKVTNDSPPISEHSERFLSGKSRASPWRKKPEKNTSDAEVISSKVPHTLVPILKHKPSMPHGADNEINDILQVSSKPIRQSARRASARPRMVPSFDYSVDIDEEEVVSLPAHLTSLTLSPKSQCKSHSYTTYTLPQTLTLQGKNHPLTPVVRGYHSAADRRTRIPLNRKSTNMNGSEKVLKPLEERHMDVKPESKTSGMQQVSAPNSACNWNRHITLPPIEQVDSSLKLQGTASSYILAPRDSKARSNEPSPRQITSTRHKICMSPVSRKAESVKVQCPEYSKLEMTKQLFEFHPGHLLLENSEIIDMEATENNKQVVRPRSRVHFQFE